ncbi:MAG: hypothetical protein BWZ10_00555 [candidate division BRC1 bacterium ADurb.BinA364]|nr:MAG: hypothetical protein BWZ10_00555 [candidate division BRC1 bacterium ADurb.BinA364]
MAEGNHHEPTYNAGNDRHGVRSWRGLRRRCAILLESRNGRAMGCLGGFARPALPHAFRTGFRQRLHSTNRHGRVHRHEQPKPARACRWRFWKGGPLRRRPMAALCRPRPYRQDPRRARDVDSAGRGRRRRERPTLFPLSRGRRGPALQCHGALSGWRLGNAVSSLRQQRLPAHPPGARMAQGRMAPSDRQLGRRARRVLRLSRRRARIVGDGALPVLVVCSDTLATARPRSVFHWRASVARSQSLARGH